MLRSLTLSVLSLGLCATVVAQSPLPTPESVLGFRPGDDFQLASYDESLAYFRALDAATPRLELVEVGRTSGGLPWYVALVSSAENLAQIDRYREIALRLAHPRDLSDQEARQLAQDGRALVHIDGGLHATEVAHAQHTIQLAYDLVSAADDPELLAIRDNVILMLWPSINPDGQNMVVEWYRSNLGTPYEVAPMPRLYQKYIGHDNNRDGYMLNMVESRVVTRVLREWEPQVLYNHHQTAPFPARIWIPPFAEPISEYVHPLMWRTVNLLGMSMAQALEERGQPGAVHMGTGFDNWYPGFMDHANNFHNVAAFLTETGLYRYATPHFYTINDFPASGRDLRPRSLYASPWEGGWWRLGDAVDYMLTASISVLDVAAKYKEDLLYNRYQAGRDVAAQYRHHPPYAYFIPQDQRDPVAPVELLRRLAFNGIEVYQLQTDVAFEGQAHPAGTWVIPMDQEFAHFVRQLFEVQEYPDLREFPEGPPDQPYDVAGWTLPYQMDVRVIEASAPFTDALRAQLVMVSGEPRAWSFEDDGALFDSPGDVGFDTDPVAAGIVPLAGRVSGSGSALWLDGAQNNTYKAINRAWRDGGTVRYVSSTDDPSVSGRWVISGLPGNALDALVGEYALQGARGNAAGIEVSPPRIGLYRPWAASMDEGWTRWLLDRYGFEYTSLRNAEVVAGDLRGKYDVILIADISPRSILEGHAKGSVPPRYVGGLAGTGVRALDAFVREGGTLVAINGSTEFAIEQLHLPVENVVGELGREKFFVAGSILEMSVATAHPVMTGMPATAGVFVARSPVFTVTDEFEGEVLAKYATHGSPLLSGYLLGEEHLQGLASALDVRHGNGRVVLLGMRPQWRGQPFGNFRIVFNAALYSAQVASVAPENPTFWERPSPSAPEPEEP